MTTSHGGLERCNNFEPDRSVYWRSRLHSRKLALYYTSFLVFSDCVLFRFCISWKNVGRLIISGSVQIAQFSTCLYTNYIRLIIKSLYRRHCDSSGSLLDSRTCEYDSKRWLEKRALRMNGGKPKCRCVHRSDNCLPMVVIRIFSYVSNERISSTGIDVGRGLIGIAEIGGEFVRWL